MVLSDRVDYSKLLPHVSEQAIEHIKKWLAPYWFHMVIKNPRDTKLGDYRYPVKGSPHKITVNAGMSKSLCFLTLTHEIAHLVAFDVYSTRILPHGKEWKQTFSQMILESIDVYEEEIKLLLLKYAKNPKASFYADKDLSEYFIRKENENVLLLKDLEEGKGFILNNRIFYKLERIKTRYICIEKKTNKKYYIAGNAPVEEISYDYDGK